MTALAPTLQSFFITYLIGQRGASPHTITAYRDTFRCCWTTPTSAPASGPVTWTSP